MFGSSRTRMRDAKKTKRLSSTSFKAILNIIVRALRSTIHERRLSFIMKQIKIMEKLRANNISKNK